MHVAWHAKCVYYRAPVSARLEEGRGAIGGPCQTKSCPWQQGCEEGGAFQWGLSNASEAWEREHSWPQDPMWTESNWPPGGVPELQLYQVCASTVHMDFILACDSMPVVCKASLSNLIRAGGA